MSLEIDRNYNVYDQGTITSDETASIAVGFGSFAGGMMYVVSTSTGAAITISWRARFSASSPVYKLCDSANTPITAIIQAGRCVEVPAELFGAMQISPVAETAGNTAVVRISAKG